MEVQFTQFAKSPFPPLRGNYNIISSIDSCKENFSAINKGNKFWILGIWTVYCFQIIFYIF